MFTPSRRSLALARPDFGPRPTPLAGAHIIRQSPEVAGESSLGSQQLTSDARLTLGPNPLAPNRLMEHARKREHPRVCRENAILRMWRVSVSETSPAKSWATDVPKLRRSGVVGKDDGARPARPQTRIALWPTGNLPFRRTFYPEGNKR